MDLSEQLLRPMGMVLEMASAEMIKIGRRMISNTIAGTTDLADETYFGDGSVFTDPARFEREREVIFKSLPHVIAWGGDLAEPGDIVARDVAGVPVIVTRGDDGALSAFLNACAHRGMTLCDGTDNTRRLTCPYHGWSYGLDGTLVGLPHRDRFPGFDPADSGLQPLPVSEQKGLVLVGLRPDVVVDGYLDPLGDAYSWLGYDTYRSGADRTFNIDANWKLTIDLNVEAYHVPSLHRDTLMPFLADHCAVDTFGPHCRMAVPFKGIEAMAEVPEEQWPDRLDTVIVTCIFPSTVLVDHLGGGGSLHRTLPAQPRASRSCTSSKVLPGRPTKLTRRLAKRSWGQISPSSRTRTTPLQRHASEATKPAPAGWWAAQVSRLSGTSTGTGTQRSNSQI